MLLNVIGVAEVPEGDLDEVGNPVLYADGLFLSFSQQSPTFS